MRKLPIAAALLFSTVALHAAAAAPYVRLGAGIDSSRSGKLLDADCSSMAPPALFGCVNGGDGRLLAARGDFGSTAVFDLAAGMEVGSRARLELTLTERPDVDFQAVANFPHVSGVQPVTADGRSLAAMVVGAIDLAPAHWRVRPFVSAGAGGARNESGAIRFAFPGISPDAVTVIRGGVNTGFAWMAGTGATVTLGDGLQLDFDLRYTDLGDMKTKAGKATIVRPRGRLVLDIAGTHAPVSTTGATVSLRIRL